MSSINHGWVLFEDVVHWVMGFELTTSAQKLSLSKVSQAAIVNSKGLQIPPGPLWTLHSLMLSSKFEKAIQGSKTDYVTDIALQKMHNQCYS
ncbi:MAG: hypothetical protein M3146_10300 [Thermoproteota archaeon]|nr:hypothetical protein [Thermoproteota archaeon]